MGIWDAILRFLWAFSPLCAWCVRGSSSYRPASIVCLTRSVFRKAKTIPVLPSDSCLSRRLNFALLRQMLPYRRKTVRRAVAAEIDRIFPDGACSVGDIFIALFDKCVNVCYNIDVVKARDDYAIFTDRNAALRTACFF